MLKKMKKGVRMIEKNNILMILEELKEKLVFLRRSL